MTNLVLDVDALLADGAELATLRHEHYNEGYGTAGEESEAWWRKHPYHFKSTT